MQIFQPQSVWKYAITEQWRSQGEGGGIRENPPLSFFPGYASVAEPFQSELNDQFRGVFNYQVDLPCVWGRGRRRRSHVFKNHTGKGIRLFGAVSVHGEVVIKVVSFHRLYISWLLQLVSFSVNVMPSFVKNVVANNPGGTLAWKLGNNVEWASDNSVFAGSFCKISVYKDKYIWKE